MRWRPYDGSRIPKAGHRTFVEDPPPARFADSPRRHGYVWPDGDAFRGSHEVLHPGQIEDVELGRFSSESDARRAVESALLAGGKAGI